LAIAWQRSYVWLQQGVYVAAIVTALVGVARGLPLPLPAMAAVGLNLASFVFPLLLTALIVFRLLWLRPAQRWIAARHAAELLKSEIFSYATGVDKYALATTTDDTFDRERDEVLRVFHTIWGDETFDPHATTHPAAPSEFAPWLPDKAFTYGPAGPDSHSHDDYLDRRFLKEVEFFAKKGKKFAVKSQYVSALLFVAWVLAATCQLLSHDALWPIITSLYGVLAAYFNQAGADFLRHTYVNTRRTLQRLQAGWQRNVKDDDSFRRYVTLVEMVLMHEHRGWQSRMQTALDESRRLIAWWRSLVGLQRRPAKTPGGAPAQPPTP
jgi:hypothetical protein